MGITIDNLKAKVGELEETVVEKTENSMMSLQINDGQGDQTKP